MWLDPEICYRALLARDARFDGRFFVGVESTGVYCRPVCTARPPKRKNCRFYPNPAAAEEAGFRPCLRCRPELAPGRASVDACSRLARTAARLIEDGALAESDLAGLAARLGTTDRHLRRVFSAEFGVSPSQYAQSQRLLLAKRLLCDTFLPVTEVAMAAGFGSLRRFNALFRERYLMQPRELRKRPQSAAGGELVFELAYEPPYAWGALLAFLAPRGIRDVEFVTPRRYLRTVALRRDDSTHRGWIVVEHLAGRHTLRLTMAATLARFAPEVSARVKHLFDLGCRPREIAAGLGPLARAEPGLRVPGAFDSFEMSVRAVIGQQITVAAARTLASRLALTFGDPVSTPFGELRLAFPDATRLAKATLDQLGRLGIIRSRGRALLELAEACACGDLRLEPGVDVEATMNALRGIAGVGEWTAQYIAMRALAWPDAFPHSDHALMRALDERSPARVLEKSETWRPWRAYAAVHLWNSLSDTVKKMTYYMRIESPVGTLLMTATDAGLTGIYFREKVEFPTGHESRREQNSHPVLRRAAQQLKEYFAGQRRSFDLPLAPSGTSFQRAVWKALGEIPYGETWSYGAIAQKIGKPKAVRAVGAANGANPLPIVLPCHRVIGADGSLTGYGGGLDRKQKLLALEQATIRRSSPARRARASHASRPAGLRAAL